jgi:hypothetical protein
MRATTTGRAVADGEPPSCDVEQPAVRSQHFMRNSDRSDGILSPLHASVAEHVAVKSDVLLTLLRLWARREAA